MNMENKPSFRRRISLLLAVVMILSNISVAVFATDDTEPKPTEYTEAATEETTEPSGEPVEETTEETTEAATGAPADKGKSVPEVTTESTTETTTEATTEVTTDATTEATTEETTEAATEATTEPATEESTEAATEETTVPEDIFFRQLMDSQSAEQMYLLVLEDMQANNAEQLLALTAEQLTALTVYAQSFPEDPEGVSDRVDLLDTLALFGDQNVIGDIEILPEEYINLNEHYASGADGYVLSTGKYILRADLQIADNAGTEKGNFVVPADATVVIDLNGFAIRGNGLYSVITTRGGTSLTIEDSSEAKTGGITGGVSTSGGGIYSVGNVTINGGSIYGNRAGEIDTRTESNSGGGIYCSGTVTMNGGKIYGNRAFRGGGVYAGNMTMNGGVIGDDTVTITWSDGSTTQYPQIPTKTGVHITNISAPNANIAREGGGLYNAGSITLNGGAVVGNRAESWETIKDNGKPVLNRGTGGGIRNGGTLTIQNQSILYGNDADNNGGGLAQGASTTTITNSKITCNRTGTYGGGIDAGGSVYIKSGADIIFNTADNNGGGITVENKGYCEVDGGRVSYNYAKSSGGGFRCVGTINLISGEVNYNRASNGGGISARTDSTETTASRIATVYLNGGVISHNTASARGGGIHIEIQNVPQPITVEANGTEISHNTAGIDGGGIHAVAAKGAMYVDLKSGTLSNNSAKNGGGISMNVSTTGGVTVSGATVSQNSASALGGGVYLAGGTFTMNGENVLFQENTAQNGAGIYLTGGQPNLYKGTLKNNTAAKDGGGIYIDRQNVTLAPTGDVTVTGNQAERGAGIFIGGTNGTDASFSLDKSAAGTVDITENIATKEGGGVCINNGYFTLDAGNIALQRNQAASGGAVAVLSGNFTMSAGTIGGSDNGNTAQTGGAVYVNGGNVALSGGSITDNTATVNGGGIAVNNGQVIMSGGSVSNNSADSGEGGGMYISSSGSKPVSVTIYSGTLSSNSASKNGGAVAVQGANSQITVQIGINKDHNFDSAGNPSFPIEHDGYLHNSCPVITDNTSGTSGGAFYISGTGNANLNIYCLTDGNNRTSGDTNALNEHMSNFMMVEGGVVYLSTSTQTEEDAGKPDLSPDGDDISGSMTIHDSIHVVSGVLELFGSKDNPRLEGSLTIDLQSDNDRYIDHRQAKEKLTISYHENFYGPDGVIASTQTAFDVSNGNTHRIYTGLYAHEGYDLYGWNINKNAIADQTQEGWYPVTEDYKFHILKDSGYSESTTVGHDHYGDLTLFAIWKANGYRVEFASGVPEGNEWSGETKAMQCKYNVSANLPANGFVWPNHEFIGWEMPNGETKQPGDSFSNLTAKKADTVTVTALWRECEHPATVKDAENNDVANLIYTVNEAKDTLTKTCNLCKYSATAKLSAQNAVYDKQKHEAVLEYSDEAFWKDAEGNLPAITYEGKTIRPQHISPDDATWTAQAVQTPCVSAGEYTAKVTFGETVAQVGYTIAKATQSAPASRPEYEKPTAGNDLTILQIPAGERVSTESGAHVQYLVRYYQDGKEVDDIVTVPDTDPDELTHTLHEAWKVYSVLARYGETDDYLPSELISAETSFLFAGHLDLTIKAEDGIDFWLGGTDNTIGSGTEEVVLYIKLRTGFYLPNEEFTFKKEVTNGSSYNQDNLTVSKTENIKDGYTIKAVSTDEDTDITVTIGGAKKIPDVTGVAKEKQHFSDFEKDDAPVISRDSAFTMYYEVTGYDRELYQEPQLNFSEDLPGNTTIILRDRKDGSYWYTRIGTATKTVKLDKFKQMGTQTPFVTVSDEQKLQFIVDFSGADAAIAKTTLVCSLSAEAKQGENAPKKVEVLKSNELTVGLGGATLMADVPQQTAGLTQTMKLTLGASGGASKYDHRDLTLVLTPKDVLPQDARIELEVAGTNNTGRPGKDGTIILELGNFRNLTADAKLTLSSRMFPEEAKTYGFEGKLFLSRTDAEKAYVNGDEWDEVDLTFTSNRQKTGITVTVPEEQRLFEKSDSIEVRVKVNPEDYIESYNVIVELHQEFRGGTFGNSLVKATIDPDTNTYTFPLKDCVDGDYCIVASLATKDEYVVNEARYYFIVQTDSEGTD